MLYLILVFGASNIPKQYGQCSVNLNGTSYDFLKYFKDSVFHFDDNEFYYYFSLCRGLENRDLPDHAPTNLLDYNVMRVNMSDKQWDNLLYMQAFDWSMGVSDQIINYNGDGDPIKIGNNWVTFDMDVRIICDPDKTEPLPSFTHSVSNIDNQYYLNVYFVHAAGCPSYVPTPSPTPEYKPDCVFISRYEADNDTGIDAHFDTLEDGPFGFRFFSDINELGDRPIFFKGCGRMECPPGFVCDKNVKYSSMWVCNQNHEDECASYGVSRNNVNHISLAGPNEDFGIKIEYNEANFNSKLVIRSEPIIDYPKGHIRFDRVGSIDQNGVLSISAQSSIANVVDIPIPVPPLGGNCTFTYQRMSQMLSMSLINLNTQDNVGWVKNVTITGLPGADSAELRYQPCGASMCPPNYTCNGDEDATVWLCRFQNCVGYGLFENSIDISLVDRVDLTRGVYAQYYGDRHTAQVLYQCDKTLPPNTLKFGDSITISGNQMSFSVSAFSACVDYQGNTPEPTPKAWVIPSPRPYPDPSPAPLRSPNPINLIHNNTHFILVELDDFIDETISYYATVGNRGQTANAYFMFRPWETVPCPTSYGKCPLGYGYANGYMCYPDQFGEKNCYPYADRSYDAWLNPINNKNLDLGAILTYNSEYDADLEFVTECTPGVDINRIKILMGTPIGYSDHGKEVMSITATSGSFCPKAFTIPTLPPTPSPTPEPTPLPSSSFYWRSETLPGKLFMELDLTAIKPHIETVVIGSHNNYYQATLAIDPDLPRPCPGECIGGGTTNIWKCIDVQGTQKCFGIGDARQGLKFEKAGSTFMDGINVVYKGGYNGLQTTITFQCNETVPNNEVDFDDVVRESALGFITIYAHTKLVCPKKSGNTPLPTMRYDTPEPTPNQGGGDVSPGRQTTTGGSVFLLIIIGGGVFYMMIGLFATYQATGKFDLPNGDFWSEFGINVATGALFIITCGSKSVSKADYDAI